MDGKTKNSPELAILIRTKGERDNKKTYNILMQIKCNIMKNHLGDCISLYYYVFLSSWCRFCFNFVSYAFSVLISINYWIFIQTSLCFLPFQIAKRNRKKEKSKLTKIHPIELNWNAIPCVNKTQQQPIAMFVLFSISICMILQSVGLIIIRFFFCSFLKWNVAKDWVELKPNRERDLVNISIMIKTMSSRISTIQT